MLLQTNDTEVFIENISEHHLEEILRYASDPLIANTSNLPNPFPKNYAEFIVERSKAGVLSQKRYSFAIMYNNQFAGVCTIKVIDSYKKIGDLSYWIAVPFWNKGVCKKATGLVLDFAKNNMDLKTIKSSVMENNYASQRVLELNGFQRVAVTENHGEYKNLRKGEIILKMEYNLS